MADLLGMSQDDIGELVSYLLQGYFAQDSSKLNLSNQEYLQHRALELAYPQDKQNIDAQFRNYSAGQIMPLLFGSNSQYDPNYIQNQLDIKNQTPTSQGSQASESIKIDHPKTVYFGPTSESPYDECDIRTITGDYSDDKPGSLAVGNYTINKKGPGEPDKSIMFGDNSRFHISPTSNSDLAQGSSQFGLNPTDAPGGQDLLAGDQFNDFYQPINNYDYNNDYYDYNNNSQDNWYAKPTGYPSGLMSENYPKFSKGRDDAGLIGGLGGLTSALMQYSNLNNPSQGTGLDMANYGQVAKKGYGEPQTGQDPNQANAYVGQVNPDPSQGLIQMLSQLANVQSNPDISQLTNMQGVQAGQEGSALQKALSRYGTQGASSYQGQQANLNNIYKTGFNASNQAVNSILGQGGVNDRLSGVANRLPGQNQFAQNTLQGIAGTSEFAPTEQGVLRDVAQNFTTNQIDAFNQRSMEEEDRALQEARDIAGARGITDSNILDQIERDTKSKYTQDRTLNEAKVKQDATGLQIQSANMGGQLALGGANQRSQSASASGGLNNDMAGILSQLIGYQAQNSTNAGRLGLDTTNERTNLANQYGDLQRQGNDFAYNNATQEASLPGQILAKQKGWLLDQQGLDQSTQQQNFANNQSLQNMFMQMLGQTQGNSGAIQAANIAGNASTVAGKNAVASNDALGAAGGGILGLLFKLASSFSSGGSSDYNGNPNGGGVIGDYSNDAYNSFDPSDYYDYQDNNIYNQEPIQGQNDNPDYAYA